MAEHDILIAGGGPVGSALALALGASEVRFRLIAPSPAGAASPADSLERFRPFALSHASLEFLRSIGAVQEDGGTPIRTVHVSERGRFGRTRISAPDHALPALGYVFDAASLARDALRAASRWRIAGWVENWWPEGEHVRVSVATGADPLELTTRLLVIADGGASGAVETVRDYGQRALVGTVVTEAPHDHVAWERFTPGGPLALLPHGDRYAFVWAVPNGSATRLESASQEALCADLRLAFGARLGCFSGARLHDSAPLALRRSRNGADRRVMVIGNAAQVLHPVAGQGLNLGLRDVMTLVRQVDRNPPEALGTEAFVQAFTRARWMDRAATIGITDLIVRVFSNESAVLGAGRSAALMLLDACPPARGFLARRMMLGARAIP